MKRLNIVLRLQPKTLTCKLIFDSSKCICKQILFFSGILPEKSVVGCELPMSSTKKLHCGPRQSESMSVLSSEEMPRIRHEP